MDDDVVLLAGLGLVAYALYENWGTGSVLDLSVYFGGGGGDDGGDGGDQGSVQSDGGQDLTVDQIYSLAEQVLDAMGITDITPAMASAIALNESGGNTAAVRQEPSLNTASYGLMQVLLTTAQWLNTIGYTSYAASALLNDGSGEASMYFGCAYLHWLRNYQGNVQTDSWVVEAYNGGPGGVGGAGPQRYYASWVSNMDSNGWSV